MKKIINAAVAVCVSIALIYGCDSTNNPVSVDGPDVSRSVNGSSENNTARINNYDIVFDGISNGDNKTTFNYTVTYSGSGPSSNNFYMEVPKCAAGSFDPSQFVSTRQKPIEYPYDDAVSQTTGIMFKSSLSRRPSSFSVTYSGDIPIGTIAATVESGNSAKHGYIAGPCKGAEDLIEISGNVFVDIVDAIGGNRVRDQFETGIYNVVVQLKAGTESIDIKRTDPTGKFSFLVPAGSYTILIPETIDGVQFNEKFFETYNFAGFKDDFDATVPSKDISPTADISIDFPFNADPDALIKGFEEKTILTNTRDAEFWRKMVQNAVNDSQGNFEVSKEEIYSLLDKIEDNNFFKTIDGKDLLPEVPFKFGNGTDIERAAVALEYLFNPSESNKTPEQLFLKQLLAAEFNIASDKYGVGGFEVDSNDISLCPGGTIASLDGKFYCNANIEEFHLALLAFGEGIAANFPIFQKISASSISSTLSQSTVVFDSFNRSGTGGLN